jgi:hypothetical protein
MTSRNHQSWACFFMDYFPYQFTRIGPSLTSGPSSEAYGPGGNNNANQTSASRSRSSDRC